MSVDVAIHDGPLENAQPWPSQGASAIQGAGAVLCFEGRVRPYEADQPIAGLTYETYDPMAEMELKRLAQETVERFSLLAIKVEHSRGWVANDACSFRLWVASAHRKEALAAMDWFIDHMKQRVPIWKRPVIIEQTEQTTEAAS